MNQFNSFIANHPNLQTLLYVLGLLSLAKLLKVLHFLFKFVRPRKNFASRYGRGSWVMITGASDGIGKQLAIKFAALGFKIILVARNRHKLDTVAATLNTDTQVIVADFQNAHQDGFFDEIIEQVRDKDISVLINNVGVDMFNLFHKLEDRDIKQLITINCLPVTLLTKRLIPQFLHRLNHKQLKSAIINVTSLAGDFPTAYFNVYSASKSYGEYLTQIISYEYPQIDVISMKPSEVSTNMTFNRPPDILTITASDCANGLLNELGYTRSTYGDWRHQIQGALYSIVPLWLYNQVIIKWIAPGWLKERDAGQKKQ